MGLEEEIKLGVDVRELVELDEVSAGLSHAGPVVGEEGTRAGVTTCKEDVVGLAVQEVVEVFGARHGRSA